jgi:integrase
MMAKNSFKFNFTKNRLLKIECPKTKQQLYKDITEKGLILIASYGGSKTFYLGKKIQEKYHRLKIGRFPDLSIVEARVKANELKTLIAKNINPMEEKIRLSKEMTFKALFDKYVDEYAKYHIKKWQEDVSMMERRAKHLYNTKISIIKRDDIQKIFNNLTDNVGKISANRFLQRLTGIFNKAIEWDLLEKNPTRSITKHKEKSRKRFINREEMSRFVEVLNNEPNQKMADLFWILLLTGARKGNVLSMQWQHINLKGKTWYIPNTKNGESQLVHLVDWAIKILTRRKDSNNTESIWVFASNNSKSGHLQEPKKVWKRICQQASLNDLRIHDLRRTHGSWMRKAGADNKMIGKALNHLSSKSTEIYDIIESDQVKEYREKATKIMMDIEENIEAAAVINNTENYIVSLKKRIEELERQLKYSKDAPNNSIINKNYI